MLSPFIALLVSLLSSLGAPCVADISAGESLNYEALCTTDTDCAEKFGEEP